MKKGKDAYIGIAIAIIGSVMMAIGILKNDNADILSKAIRICLECIGIG